jgi:2-isopropylmalate synthase
LQIEFGAVANQHIDALAREVTATELRDLFWAEYVNRESPWAIEHFHSDGVNGRFACRCSATYRGEPRALNGEGNGPLAALANALTLAGEPPFEIAFYAEHSLGTGSDASALAYIQIRRPDGTTRFGAGTDTSIELASVKALASAINR